MDVVQMNRMELVANDILRMLLYYLHATQIFNLSETTPRMRERLQGNVTEMRYDIHEERLSKFPLVRSLKIYDWTHVVEGVEELYVHKNATRIPEIYFLPSRLVRANLVGYMVMCELPPTLTSLVAHAVSPRHLRASNLVSLETHNFVPKLTFEDFPKTLTSCGAVMDFEVFDNDISHFERLEVLWIHSGDSALGFNPDTITCTANLLMKMIDLVGVRPTIVLMYNFDLNIVSQVPNMNEINWVIYHNRSRSCIDSQRLYIDDLPQSVTDLMCRPDNLYTRSGNWDGAKFPSKLKKLHVLYVSLTIEMIKALESTNVEHISMNLNDDTLVDLSSLKNLKRLDIKGDVEISPSSLANLREFHMCSDNPTHIDKCAAAVLGVKGEVTFTINGFVHKAQSLSEINEILSDHAAPEVISWNGNETECEFTEVNISFGLDAEDL